MPQRFLRPGIRTSERWNSVSRDAQVLYVAILTLVDDYGRYDGRHSILCADAFTIWNEKHPDDVVTPQRIAALSCELRDSSLVDFYEIDGKKILQVVQWQERVRDGAKEKWPKNSNPLRNPAESCVPLPPSSPPAPAPAPAGTRSRDAALPTWNEVKEVASMRNVPEASALKFFNYHQDNNLWLNKFDRPIDWRRKIVSWALDDRQTKGATPQSHKGKNL